MNVRSPLKTRGENSSASEPEIGYESGYKTYHRVDNSSSGAELPAQLRFNVWSISIPPAS